MESFRALVRSCILGAGATGNDSLGQWGVTHPIRAMVPSGSGEGSFFYLIINADNIAKPSHDSRCTQSGL